VVNEHDSNHVNNHMIKLRLLSRTAMSHPSETTDSDIHTTDSTVNDPCCGSSACHQPPSTTFMSRHSETMNTDTHITDSTINNIEPESDQCNDKHPQASNDTGEVLDKERMEFFDYYIKLLASVKREDWYTLLPPPSPRPPYSSPEAIILRPRRRRR